MLRGVGLAIGGERVGGLTWGSARGSVGLPMAVSTENIFTACEVARVV